MRNHRLEAPDTCVAAEKDEAREEMSSTPHCSFFWQL